MANHLLWAHLLPKDATPTTTTTTTDTIPIAPQDKTATSMRMLIHDTQVNLEKFSTRLDGLLHRVDDCRSQVINANKLLDVERDKVLTEIIAMTHRSQSDMKAHVGTPAQASALECVRLSQVSAEKSVQALEKRIDALQALFQTHMHATQSIHDRHLSQMGALEKRIDVLQAFLQTHAQAIQAHQDQQRALMGCQMDQIKTAMSDMVANAVLAMTRSVHDLRSTVLTNFPDARDVEKTSTRLGPSTMSGSCYHPSSGIHENNALVSSPLDGRHHGQLRSGLKRPHEEQGSPFDRPQRLPGLAVSPENPRLCLRTPRTPRRPLADLSISSGNRLQRHVTSPTSHRSTRPPTAGLTSGLQRSNVQDPDIAGRRSPSSARASNPDGLSKATAINHATFIPTSPSSRPFPAPDGNETSAVPDKMPDIPPIELVPVSHSDGSPPTSMSLRDRRAQISRIGRAETRRFIPLVPWSDEDE